MLTKELLLETRVSDVLLEFADLSHEDITTSDLQGVATVEARKIIEMIREDSK